MTNPLLQQGLDLTIYGMGTVFLFLTLLVVFTLIVSKILIRFFSEPIELRSEPHATSSSKASVDPGVLAILQKAIDEHRKTHK